MDRGLGLGKGSTRATHRPIPEFFVEDDSKVTQLGIEAGERDYLIVPGGRAEALAKLLGETVQAKGWLLIDEEEDAWLLVHDFEAKPGAM